jgi:hypothetical protein
MPDPTNLAQLKAQKAQELRGAVQFWAVQQAVTALDDTYRGESLDYRTLVVRLQAALDAELARLAGPPKDI